MSTSTIGLERRASAVISRVVDYVEMAKPRISALVLLTVAVSAFVARWGHPDAWAVAHAMFGTLLVAASASALNQWIERRSDALMERTADRPLPAGRLSSAEVLAVGLAGAVLGVGYLAVCTRASTALWALATWATYVCLYTPLKARTSLNTAVGAVAGAMPVLIGWSAAGGSFGLADPRAAAMFLIVFLWQFPHFMAIAWLYRRQYDRAGLKMLPVVDPTGRSAARQAVLGAIGLLPASLVLGLPFPTASGVLYLSVALLLGVAQLWLAARFMVRRDETSARWLLRGSLVYLPSVLVLLVLVCIPIV